MGRGLSLFRAIRQRFCRQGASSYRSSSRDSRRRLRCEPLEERQLLSITVESLTPTPSGFVAQFSDPIETSVLNLYDAENGALGQADVTLHGSTVGDVSGSLVVEGDTLTFIATGGPLAADTYTVTLRSGANAIKDQTGALLDGNGDGTAGDNYVSSFSAAPQTLVISMADFARGPTQPADVPAQGSGAALPEGLTIHFNDAGGITSGKLTLTYDPDLLTITAVEAGPDVTSIVPPTLNVPTPGVAVIAFVARDGAPLPSGPSDLLRIIATVPDTASYGAAHILHIDVESGDNGIFSGSPDNRLAATADDAIHVVAFPGDANANWRYDTEDARLIARVGVGFDTGFAVEPAHAPVPAAPKILYPTIDAVIIGDVTGQDGLTALDASDILRRVVGLPTPNIPELPLFATITAATPTNDDPILFTILFNETVTGFDLADLSVSGAAGAALSAQNLQQSATDPRSYTVQVTGMTQDGNVSLKLNKTGSEIENPGGKPLAWDATATVTYDTTPPGATLEQAGTQADPTNTGPIHFTVVFAEPVSGFAAGDVTLGGTAPGTLTAVVSAIGGDGTSYDVAVSGMTGSGTVTASIGAGVAHDAAGNGNLASTSTDNVVTYDVTPPTADIADVTPDPRNTHAGTVTISFSEAVTGVDIADFALTRDGATVDLSGLTVGGSGATYTLDLSGVTAEAGTYVLTLTASGSGIQDAAGNLLSVDASDTWLLETTAPTTDIVDVTPDPRNTHAGTVTISFTEPVTGVDIADFALTRDGATVDLSGLTVGGSGATYTLDLSGVTGAEGMYVLTLTASGSGIQDAAGNLLLADASDEWVVDTTAPTADIRDVTPDPRTTSAGTVFIDFYGGSWPVTGADIADFGLTRDGAVVDISGLTVLNYGDACSIDLSSVTGAEGMYVLTLTASGSGIQDAAGNLLLADASDAWVVDTTSPAADIADVTPDPRNTNAGTVTINFTESITGMDIADFGLTRDGATVDISALTVGGSGAAYTLDLSSVTGVAGTYVLTLTALGSGIQDAAGNALSVDASDTWVMETTAPTADIADVTPDPRNTHAGTVTISFSEPVTGVSIGDFALTRDGAGVDISALTVGGSGATYTIDLSGVTAAEGTYVLTLTAATSGIQDLTGNALAEDASDQWVVDTTAPTADVWDVTPDPRNTHAGTVTISFSEAVTGVTIGDFGLTRDGASVDISGLSVTDVAGPGWLYGIDLSSVTALAGTYLLTLTAATSGIQDAAGNLLSVDASDTWVMETTAPTADIADVTPDPRNTHAGTVTINFTESVTGVGIEDFALTRDGGTVEISALSVGGSGSTYTIDLSSATGAEGTYVLTLTAAGSGIQDLAGNPLSADGSETWVVDKTAPAGYTITVGDDLIKTGEDSATSFTFADAEEGATYSLTVTSSQGGTPVTSSGPVTSPTQQVTGIDVSTLPDGTLTYSVTLTDVAGNAGTPATATAELARQLFVGAEFQVNTFSTGDQRLEANSGRAIAMDSDGDFVVTWMSYGQDAAGGWGVYAQRYNAAGAPQGTEFLVNTTTSGDQKYPAVDMDAAGNFVVAWQSQDQDGSGWGVYAQRYNTAGVAQGVEFQVNTETNSDQSCPAVAMDSDGDFVVAWTSQGQDGSGPGIYAQRYNAAGAAQGTEFQVNTYTNSAQVYSSVAMDSDGDFVVTWSSYGQAPDGGYGIYAQRYSAAGVAQGGEFHVNTFTGSHQFASSVAMDADGDFVVAWHSYGQDGGQNGIYAQRYNAAGVAQGGEFRVNSATAYNQRSPSVAMDAGGFVVTWESNLQDGGGWGIYAQRYSAAGVAQGGEFLVNSATASDQSNPAVAMDAEGDFVVAWESNGQDGSGWGVFAQRFAMPPTATTSASVSGTAIVFTINFHEDVTGFTVDDLTAAGSLPEGLTLQNFTPVSAALYSVEVVGMTASQKVTLRSPLAGALADLAGNLSAIDAVFAEFDWIV